jgi:hypothetical protein
MPWQAAAAVVDLVEVVVPELIIQVIPENIPAATEY